MWTPPQDQGLPASPPFRYVERSRDGLRQVVSQFDLGRALRYAKGYLAGVRSSSAHTWCNLAAHDITDAAGCPIPRSIDGRYLTANDQFDWLAIAGELHGWERSSLERASVAAERGSLVVAAWRNPDPAESGHIAVGVPAPRVHRPGELWIAQAGRRNFACGTVGSGFGSKTPTLWTHP